MHGLGIGAVSRAAGFAAIAAAIIATAVHLRHGDTKPDPAGVAAAATNDPLAWELVHCRAIGLAAKDDATCASAWAENRRRFFTYAPLSAPSPSTPAASAKAGQPQ